MLYNYFDDKEDLLAQALLHHVGTVMNESRGIPEAGTGSVAGNLTVFIDGGMESLYRVVPAFAGLMSLPNVLRRFHAMVGGNASFAAPAGEQDPGGKQDPGGNRTPAGNRTQAGNRTAGHQSQASPAASLRSCSGTCGPNSGWAGSTRAPTWTRPPR